MADNSTTSALTAIFRDDFSNVISAGTVNWSGQGAQDTFGQATSSLTSGSAINTLRSTLAHSVPVTADMGGVAVSANVTFVPGAPDASQSMLVLSPNTLTADGSAQSTITAIFNDAFGNPSPGNTVIFGASGTNNTLGGASAVTNSSGMVATPLSSTKAETKAVTASSAGAVLSGNVAFVPGSPNATLSTLAITPNITVADGASAVTASATIRDAFGNPIAGLAASVAGTGPDTTVSPSSGTTSAAGVFTSLITTTTVQAQDITLVAGPYSLTRNANFTVGPPSLATSSFIASPDTGLSSDGATPSTLTITLKDSLSRILPSQPIRFSTAGPQGRLMSTTAITDGLGMAQTALTSMYAGNIVAFANSSNVVFNTGAQFSAKPSWCSTRLSLGGRTTPLSPSSANFTDANAADINQDGNLDLIFTNDAGGINIMFGQGYGKFPSPVSYPLGGYVNNAVIADFNHDGFLDIAASVGSNYVSIFLGKSAPSMTARGSVNIGSSVSGAGVCAGDINKDGHMDLVSVYNSPPGFAILLGDGAGGFTNSATYSAISTVSRCLIEDFDGDGYSDVAVSSYGHGSVDVYYGSSNGTLSAPNSFSTGSTAYTLRTALLNQDSLPDIVYADQTSGTVGVLLGTPGRSFQPKVSYGSIYITRDVKLIDLNGDGNKDIVANSGSGGVSYLLGKGDGSFSAIAKASTQGVITYIAPGDFDNDGAVDIAYTLTNTIGGITFASSPGILPSLSGLIGTSLKSGAEGVVSADFNKDGNMDLIGTGSGTPAVLLLGTGAGQFPTTTTITGTSTSGSSHLATGDLNGDGNTDVVMINHASPTITVLINKGDGNFTISTINGPANASGSGSVVIGDINGDGLDDFWVTVLNNNIYQYITADPSASSFSTSTINTTSGNCQGGRVADVTNDGFKDLLVGCNALVYLPGNGTGSYGTPKLTGTGVGTNALRPDVADLNGDGYIDVMAADSTNVVAFINQKDGTFTASRIAVTSTSTGYLSAQDMNGDGISDLVVAAAPALNVFLGTGTGSFGAAQVYPGPRLLGVSVSDLNNDGKPDIAAAATYQGLIEYLSAGCSPY